MKRWLDAWNARCAASAPLRFVDANLRGAGQVMFQDHPLSGFLFIVAIFWGAVAAGATAIAVAGLVGLVASTGTTCALGVDRAAIGAGLHGYNGYLVGLALATFMPPSAALWLYVVFGGGIATIATLATARLCATWDAPALTAPFVVVAWLMLLATHAFGNLHGALPESGAVVPLAAAYADPLRAGDFLRGTLLSVSQVFLKGNAVAALLLLAGLAVSAWRAAAWALVGAFVAVVAAHALGAESDLVTGGLMGFSPVLTAIALGAVFAAPGLRTTLVALVATLATVIAQGAINAVVQPFGIPSLTAPFVVVTWGFLLARPAAR
ncbi:MAG: urea transporter [Proteobacteria bacterium]|nr:urea transporter [Pseudomonadota bacterium]